MQISQEFNVVCTYTCDTSKIYPANFNCFSKLKQEILYFLGEISKTHYWAEPIQIRFLDREGKIEFGYTSEEVKYLFAPNTSISDTLQKYQYQDCLSKEAIEEKISNLDNSYRQRVRVSVVSPFSFFSENETKEKITHLPLNKFAINEIGFDGVLIGELHDDISPKKFILDNLVIWQTLGFNKLYSEFFLVRQQKYLDAYFSNDEEEPPYELKSWCIAFDAWKKFGKTPYNHGAILKTCKKEGIKIIGLDDYHLRCLGEEAPKRYTAFNESTLKIFSANPPENKYLVYAGQGHTHTGRNLRFQDIFGLAEYLPHCVAIYVRDTAEWQTTLSLHQRTTEKKPYSFFRFSKHQQDTPLLSPNDLDEFSDISIAYAVRNF